MKHTRPQTLEQLEKDVWPTPEFASSLVLTCHRLRKKRLCDFTVEDLRIMIGQGIGVNYLLPIALEVLKEDPFAEGDFFEGDLLIQLVKLDPPVLSAQATAHHDLIEASRAALQSADPVLSDPYRALVERFLERS